MKSLRALISLKLALITGLAIHLDWHLARPMDQRLSAGWSAHWILAIPLFLGVAWYFARRHPVQGPWPVILTVGLGVFLGQVVEPVLEVIAGDTFAEAYEPARVRAFGTFVATGLLTLVVSLTGLRFFVRDKDPAGGRPGA